MTYSYPSGKVIGVCVVNYILGGALEKEVQNTDDFSLPGCMINTDYSY